MSGEAGILIDRCIGETRTAKVEQGRIAEIHIECWSERETLARVGSRYRGRVTALEPGLGGAFVDLGRGALAWMPLKGKSGVTEGAAVEVVIRAEGHGDKGPLAVFETLAEPVAKAPALLAEAGPPFEGETCEASLQDRADIDAAIEAALSAQAPIPGGGTLWIEHTRALTAIDVDSGGREMKGEKARAIRALNRDAADEAVYQVRLRGLAGLIAIDLPHVPRPLRKEIDAALRQAFARDPRPVAFAPMSRFGIAELARERRGRSLREILLDGTGAPGAETAALDALRALEREAAADRGARLVLRCGAESHDWLAADSIGWRAAMTERIGARFTLQADLALAPRAHQVSPG